MKTNRREFLKGGLAGTFGAFLTRAGVGRGEEAVVENIAPYADFHAKLDDLARRVVEASARHKALYPEEWDGSFDGVSDNVSWDHSADTGGKAFDYIEVADYDWPEYADAPIGSPDAGAIVVVGGDSDRWIVWGPTGSDENGTGTFGDPVATKACAQSIADNPPFRV